MQTVFKFWNMPFFFFFLKRRKLSSWRNLQAFFTWANCWTSFTPASPGSSAKATTTGSCSTNKVYCRYTSSPSQLNITVVLSSICHRMLNKTEEKIMSAIKVDFPSGMNASAVLRTFTIESQVWLLFNTKHTVLLLFLIIRVYKGKPL